MNMEHRLAPLYLLHPPASTPWAGTPGQTLRSKIKRKEAEPLQLELPLFWYDPRWCDVPADIADQLAISVSRNNVLVSALRSDLSSVEEDSEFHKELVLETEKGDEPIETQGPARHYPRIVPYRPERYGLSPKDFDDAMIIDVRLMMSRDTSGRFAYSPDQIAKLVAFLISKVPEDFEQY